MKSIICSTFAACVVSLLLARTAAAQGSFVDPLDAPAEISPLAQYSHLLAIARAGLLAGVGLADHVIVAPDGTHIGQIDLPEVCSNLCFGGAKGNRLFMTASQSLYSVFVETTGAR